MKTSTSSNSSSGGKPWPTLAALLLVSALGMLALHRATMGFEVVSTEDGRRLAISRAPMQLPRTAVHAPQAAELSQLLRNDGRITIMTFFYSSCNALCSVLGDEFQQLQAQIHAKGLQQRVRLLSISFDPRDDAAALASYARRQRADPAIWQIASIDSASQRKALLDQLGIVVLPAPLGEFQHNAALHLIDRNGKLVQIDDYENPVLALEHAIRRSTP
jgi:protein SCO1/2